LLISVLFAPLCQNFSSLGTKLRIGLKNGPGQIRIVIFSLFSNRMIRISSVVALLWNEILGIKTVVIMLSSATTEDILIILLLNKENITILI
jgi:hypothetical protein